MVLKHEPSYPSARSYVLKLHRDASPQPNRMTGRLENLSTGRYFEFTSGDQLLACLTQDLKWIDSPTRI